MYASNAERQAAYRARRAEQAAAGVAKAAGNRPAAPAALQEPRALPAPNVEPGRVAALEAAFASAARRADETEETLAALTKLVAVGVASQTMPGSRSEPRHGVPGWSRLSQEVAAAATQAAVVEVYLALLSRRIAKARAYGRPFVIGKLPA